MKKVSLRRNDRKEESGGGVPRRDVVPFSSRGSGAKEDVLCEVLCRGSKTQVAGVREQTAEWEAGGRDAKRQLGFFLRVFRRPLSICNES